MEEIPRNGTNSKNRQYLKNGRNSKTWKKFQEMEHSKNETIPKMEQIPISDQKIEGNLPHSKYFLVSYPMKFHVLWKMILA